MKISRLSYTIENVVITDPDNGEEEKYTSIFYAVDGEKIQHPDDPEDEFNPIYAQDVLDKDAEEQNLVILFHCFCGIWDCSAIVAHVEELPSKIIKWTVKEHRGKKRPAKEYYFDKNEYEETMKKIKQEAKRIIGESENH